MQASKIMIAVAALVCGTAVIAKPNADTIAISSGASATKGNLKLALTSLCSAASGTLTEFTSGSNISTYVCADTAVTAGTYASKLNTSFKKFAGTNFAELRLNVTGGSFTAVCALNNWPASTVCGTINAGSAPDKYLDPETGSLVLPATNQVVVGGLMDTAPENWGTDVTLGLTLPTAEATGVAQTFGVAVSPALYAKLFNAQKNPAVGGGATVAFPISNSCAEADTGKLECIPTVSKAQMASIMVANEFNAAYSNGVGFLTGDAADNGTVLEYNRRADTSGTQASAQAYFLGTSCASNPLPVVPSAAVDSNYDLGAIRVFAHSGTGGVRTQLSASGVYGIGVVSGENKGGTGQTWKWVRIQGAAIGENAVPATVGVTNRDSVKNGSYDFYFESKVVPGSASGASAFWGAVTGALSGLSAPTGLLNASDLGTFNKAGFACQASVAP